MGEGDLAEAGRIVRRCLGSQGAKVFLIGSRARGAAGRHSDIDIAILPSAPLAEGTLGSIRDALEESSIPYHVDVLDLSRVDESFRARALSEGIPWDG